MAAKKEEINNKDYSVIIKPIYTEKVTLLGDSKKSAVAFKVDKRANKTAIKSAIEQVFSVEVDKVRTCNYMGKLKRMNKDVGRRTSYKKAYVTLKEGHTIDLVEGI